MLLYRAKIVLHIQVAGLSKVTFHTPQQDWQSTVMYFFAAELMSLLAAIKLSL